jgi:hypothetical protein
MTLECRGQFGREDFIEFIQFVSTFEVEIVGVLFQYCTGVPGEWERLVGMFVQATV